MTVFLNTEIKTDSFLENLGNFCLMPVRTLFQGKTFYSVDKVFLKKESKQKTHVILRIVKVFFAVIFFFPCVFIGILSKSLSHLSSSVRQTTRDFIQTSQQLSRIIIEGQTSQIRLNGDPKDLDPSVKSFQRGMPYQWIEKNIPSPRKMDLHGFKPHIVERIFTRKQDFNSLVELDISNTSLVDEQVAKIIQRCPNLRVIKVDGLKISRLTFDLIISTCQTLDKKSKEKLASFFP